MNELIKSFDDKLEEVLAFAALEGLLKGSCSKGRIRGGKGTVIGCVLIERSAGSCGKGMWCGVTLAIAVSGGGVTRQRGKVGDVTHKHPR